MATRYEIRQQAIQKEANRVLQQLHLMGEARCVSVVAKYLLLNAPMTWNGEMIWPTAKSIGAGVYKITKEKR